MDKIAFRAWMSDGFRTGLPALRMDPTPGSFTIFLSTCQYSDGSSVRLSSLPEFAGAFRTLLLSLYRNGL